MMPADLAVIAPPVGQRREAPSLDIFVDPLFGIVVETDEFLEDVRAPRLHSTHVVIADPELTIGANTEFGGGGTGVDAHSARLAAIGEAVERYSASFVDEQRIFDVAEVELDIEHVELHRLRLFTDDQLARWRRDRCGYEAGDPTRSIGWVDGWSLTHQCTTLVPAQFVFLAPARGPDEPLLCPQISTGLALGTSAEGAAIAGLLECVERDAFTLTWELSRTPLRIDVLADPQLAHFVDRLCATSDIEWAALWLGDDLGVPVVLVCCRVPGADGIGLAVGAAAALRPHPAVDKAVREAFQSLSWARLLRQTGDPFPQAAGIASFEDHVRYWAEPSHACQASFLTASTAWAPVTELPALGAEDGNDPAAALTKLVGHLAGLGVEVVVVDVTSPDVAAAGFHVVRVLTPDLCLLDVEASARFHGRPRLLREARRAGVERLNPLPHPFP